MAFGKGPAQPVGKVKAVSTVELPTERRVASLAKGFATAKILIYGPPKTGKSTFAASFPDALILDCEGSYTGLDGMILDIKSLADLRGAYEQLVRGHQYKWIVIDSLSAFYRLASIEYCEANGVNTEVEVGYGKGTTGVKTNVLNLLTQFTRLGCGLVVIGHSQVELVEPSLGAKYSKHQLIVPAPYANDRADLCRTIQGSMDVMLFLDVDHERVNKSGQPMRVLRTAATQSYDAGDRFNVLPPVLDLPEGVSGYEVLAKPYRAAVKREEAAAAKASKRADAPADAA